MGKGARTRATILTAAVETACLGGFDGLNLKPLADRVGMTKSGLYAHFGSKEALQLATLEHAAERFQTASSRRRSSKPPACRDSRASSGAGSPGRRARASPGSCPFFARRRRVRRRRRPGARASGAPVSRLPRGASSSWWPPASAMGTCVRGPPGAVRARTRWRCATRITGRTASLGDPQAPSARARRSRALRARGCGARAAAPLAAVVDGEARLRERIRVQHGNQRPSPRSKTPASTPSWSTLRA